jgi:hypothetical protein
MFMEVLLLAGASEGDADEGGVGDAESDAEVEEWRRSR